MTAQHLGSTIGPCDVKLKGGIYGHAPIKSARITGLGSSPNASFKLYEWAQEKHPSNHPLAGDDFGPYKFIEIDRLTQATLTINDRDASKLIITGLSEMVRTTMGNASPDEQTATWEVHITGCLDCGGN